MKIDLAVAVFLLFFGVMGLISGAIRQLAHLGGLLAAFLGARPLAQILAPIASKELGYPPLFTSIVCTFLLFFALYVLGMLITKVILTKAFPDGEQGALNRFGGMLLGAGKVGLILFVILSGLVFLEKPIGARFREVRKETQASIAMALARRYNVFTSMPQLEGLSKLAEASRSPAAAAKLAEDPRFKSLQQDRRMKALVNDSTVKHAFETGDYSRLLGSVKVLDALNDPKLSEKLAELAKADLD